MEILRGEVERFDREGVLCLCVLGSGIVFLFLESWFS